MAFMKFAVRRTFGRWRSPCLVLAACLVTACASLPVPPRLDPVQQTAVAATHFDAIVFVKSETARKFPDTRANQQLTEALTKTGMFKEVKMNEPDQAYDLVASYIGWGSPFNPIPVVPAVTLGIVPIWGKHSSGPIFSLASACATQSPVQLNANYEGTAMMGWAAMGAAVSPNHLVMPNQKAVDERYVDWLRWTLAKHRPEIEALIRDCRDRRQAPVH